MAAGNDNFRVVGARSLKMTFIIWNIQTHLPSLFFVRLNSTNTLFVLSAIKLSLDDSQYSMELEQYLDKDTELEERELQP